ncbi:MAG: hypothetical protein C3F11_06455 [Methylocystaceae bacterium]|nr:MAG: hypothetical protein C3F11_06455 [Methylocystaceae bacterium]
MLRDSRHHRVTSAAIPAPFHARHLVALGRLALCKLPAAALDVSVQRCARFAPRLRMPVALVTIDHEKERVSWANTPDDVRAFRLYKADDLRRLVGCDAPGWESRDGVCFPRADAQQQIHGWRLR